MLKTLALIVMVAAIVDYQRLQAEDKTSATPNDAQMSQRGKDNITVKNCLRPLRKCGTLGVASGTLGGHYQ